MDEFLRSKLDSTGASSVDSGFHSMSFSSSGGGSGSFAMDVLNGEDIKGHCLRTLADVGAPAELSSFYADVLQCEYDMTRTVYWLYNDLTTRVARQPKQSLSDPHLQPGELFSALQNMTKYFRGWKAKVDDLSRKGLDIPPFQVSPSSPMAHSQVLHAVCDFETDQVNLREGEEMVITDASKPDWLRVRNSNGDEGYVPALSCIIPTPDYSALTAVERLQILLLTSWAECLRKVRSILIATMTTSTRHLLARWNTWLNGRRYSGQIGQGLQKISDVTSTLDTLDTRDLTKLHRYLCRIESELLGISTSPDNGLPIFKETVANLDKGLLCFQTFYTQWRHFRRELQKAPRPIRIVEQWEKLQRASQCNNFKYYELKMVLDEVERVEEVTHVEPHQNGSTSGASKSKLESVESDKMTEVSQEERKRYVVKSVVDPTSGEKMSLRQAVDKGVVDYRKGLYVTDPDTGQGIPITEAISCGDIAVEYTYVRRTLPVVDVVSLITVRRRVIDHAYTITGAIDATTAERLDCIEAIGRGVLDLGEAEYVNGHTGARLPIDEAIERGWVFADFDDDGGRLSPRYSSSTHAVLGVIDRRSGRLLTLTDAIRRGLVDSRTGDYIDNRTGRRVYIAEAIRQGLVKTRLIEQHDSRPGDELDRPLDARTLVVGGGPILPADVTNFLALGAGATMKPIPMIGGGRSMNDGGVVRSWSSSD